MSRISADFDVYWNLHRHKFSVLFRKTGRIEEHTDNTHLQIVSFVVREAGRQRVLEEKRKNVHAFVRGFWCMPARYHAATDHDGRDAQAFVVTYDPYRAPFFFDRDTKQEVLHANYVWCSSQPYTTTINGLLHSVPRPVLFAKGLVYGERFVEGYAK